MFFSKKVAPVSWIVVFLGNPGAKYANTRHNAGFMTADAVERSAGFKINRLKFSAMTGAFSFGEQRVLLMKPQSYMNLSGNSVRQAMRFHKVPLSNVLAISDDVALPAGKLRIRRGGSAGGHNGLKDIIEKCSGEGFPRIKIGVGAPPHTDYEMADWVLAKLSGEDLKIIAEAAARAAEAMEAIITRGIDYAMAEYN